MGFKARPVYELEFAADTGFEGLEVAARGADVATYLDILRYKSTNDAEDTVAALHRFAGLLVSWNLEDDDDQPIPATFEGMQQVDNQIVTAILNAWTEKVAGVSGPLAGRSTSGGPPPTLPDLDLPMESPSPPT